ncbi:MAG TPA: DoxX family membrane protein [Sumerlaeia bacterium]|nr:DoxX family membrane protein [Sumerlaeia bacterium]
MYEQPKEKEEKTASVVSLLIRLVVGVVLLFAGINKLIMIFSGEPGYGRLIQNFVDGVKGTWAYNWPFRAFMYAFFALLPWLETGLGLLVSLGYKTRLALIAAAVLLGHLMFGMILQGKADVVANNGQYVVFAAIAYYSATQGDRYSLDAWIEKK